VRGPSERFDSWSCRLLGLCMLTLPGCTFSQAVLELPQSREVTELQVQWSAFASGQIEIGWTVTFGRRSQFRGIGQWSEEGILTLDTAWLASDCARPRLFAGREELELGGRNVAIGGGYALNRGSVLSLARRKAENPECVAILFTNYVDSESGLLDYRLQASTMTGKTIATLTLPREPRLHRGKWRDLIASPLLALVEVSTVALLSFGLLLGGGH